LAGIKPCEWSLDAIFDQGLLEDDGSLISDISVHHYFASPRVWSFLSYLLCPREITADESLPSISHRREPGRVDLLPNRTRAIS